MTKTNTTDTMVHFTMDALERRRLKALCRCMGVSVSRFCRAAIYTEVAKRLDRDPQLKETVMFMLKYKLTDPLDNPKSDP